MQVLMLRNVGEERSLSMKLYADRIARSLAGQCEIRDVLPWSPSGAGWQKYRPVTKAAGYVARFGAYPLTLVRKKGDVYHIVDHAYAHLVSCLPARRTVVTCHDIMLHKVARGEFGSAVRLPKVAARLLNFSLGFLAKSAAVIATSQATADDLMKYIDVPREKIRVIHNGVGPEFAAPPHPQSRRAARSQFGFGERPVILHVGNNWFYKNLEGLIRALALLKDSPSGGRPILVKVGKGLTEGQQALARSLGVSELIREVGLLNDGELQSAYWGADVLAFPSLWEGFGWPPLEAMASGTPVVCSSRGSLGEVVGDAALIVEPEEPESIAGGIRRVLEDGSLRQRLVQKGYRRAEEFAWEKAAAQVLQVYKEVGG
jgi:glycosyltransferase involved in cell wall biosynthesis